MTCTKDFLDFTKYRKMKWVIVGEGCIGKIIIDVMSADEIAIKNGCCLVDDGYKSHDFFRGIPVYELSSFLRSKNIEEYIFFNTVTSIPTEKYRSHLADYGITNVIDVNTMEQIAPFAINNVKNYLYRNGVSVRDKEIMIHDFVFPNPFLKTVSMDVAYTFATDAWDLIFPVWLDDYSKSFDGPYESEHVKVEKDDVVIDCGGNIGISVANVIARGCKKVYSFEPVVNESIKACQKLWKDKMSLYTEALSDHEGIATMHINSKLGRESYLEKNTSTQDITKEVKLITIDHFVRTNNIEKIDFIKFCIGEEEPKVLRGAKETLKRFTPKLAIFPYSHKNAEELSKKIENIILRTNSNYKIEYAGTKMFAYID